MIAKIPIQPAGADDRSCRPIRRDDLEDIFALDEKVFGGDRSKLLLSFFSRAPEFAWVARTEAALEGYVFGRHGYYHEHVGPLAATSETIARKLVTRGASRPGRQIVFNRRADDWTGLLQSAGFELERPLIRMYRGSRMHTEYESYQFGIAGPEFG